MELYCKLIPSGQYARELEISCSQGSFIIPQLAANSVLLKKDGNIIEVHFNQTINTIPLHSIEQYKKSGAFTKVMRPWIRTFLRTREHFIDDIIMLKLQQPGTNVGGHLIFECAGSKYVTDIGTSDFIITVDHEAGIISLLQAVFYFQERPGSGQPASPSTPLTLYYLLPLDSYFSDRRHYYNTADLLNPFRDFEEQYYSVCNLSVPNLFDRVLSQNPEHLDRFLNAVTVQNMPDPGIKTYKITNAKVHPVYMTEADYNKRAAQWRGRNCRHGARTKAAAHIEYSEDTE